MIKPIGTHVLVRRSYTLQDTLNQSVANRPLAKQGRKEDMHEGTIIELGGSYPIDNTISLVVGDKVLFGELSGRIIDQDNGSQMTIILRQDEIEGIIT